MRIFSLSMIGPKRGTALSVQDLRLFLDATRTLIGEGAVAEDVGRMIERAAAAVERVIDDGVREAMNLFNAAPPA